MVLNCIYIIIFQLINWFNAVMSFIFILICKLNGRKIVSRYGRMIVNTFIVGGYPEVYRICFGNY